jgi:4'-phosphopantetheinyl transferase
MDKVFGVGVGGRAATGFEPPGEARPPGPFELEDAEVQVWLAALDDFAPSLSILRPLLSPDERARAARFHFEKHRVSYSVWRGLLRVLLGHYLGEEPGALKFCYGPFGKPALDGGRDDLRFNCSHSDRLALYAFARGREVGVDVEHVRPDFGGVEIAERFFSAREVAALLAVPKADRSAAFFGCWTRKEAFIKVVGEGLSFPLHQFEVSLSASETDLLLSVKGSRQEAARWLVCDLTPGHGYRGALAAEGRDWRPRCRRLTPRLLGDGAHTTPPTAQTGARSPTLRLD